MMQILVVELRLKIAARAAIKTWGHKEMIHEKPRRKN